MLVFPVLFLGEELRLLRELSSHGLLFGLVICEFGGLVLFLPEKIFEDFHLLLLAV